MRSLRFNPVVEALIYSLEESQYNRTSPHYKENVVMLTSFAFYALRKINDTQEENAYQLFLDYLSNAGLSAIMLKRLMDFNLYLKSAPVVEHQAKIITLIGYLDKLQQDESGFGRDVDSRLKEVFKLLDKTPAGCALKMTISGIYFGYPFCCIFEHLTWGVGSRVETRKLSKDKEGNPLPIWWKRSGFVPCESCAGKPYPDGMDETLNAINQNRIHPVDFTKQST